MPIKHKEHPRRSLCYLEEQANASQDYLKGEERRFGVVDKINELQNLRIAALEALTKAQQACIDAATHRHNKHHFESVRAEERMLNQLDAFKSDVNNWRLVGLVGLGGWAVSALLLAFVFMYNSDITIVF